MWRKSALSMRDGELVVGASPPVVESSAGEVVAGDCELCGFWCSDLVVLACGACRARYGLNDDTEVGDAQ